MGKYMLITVCEREIMTDIFNTFDDARKAMMDEVWKEILESNFDIDEAAQFMNDDSHTWSSDSGYYDVLEFGKYYAWSNVNDDYPMDWRIVGIS